MISIDRTTRRSPRFRTFLTAAVTLALITASVSIGGATAVADRSGQQEAIPVDSCTTIDEPGTYRLTESIENSTTDVCIDVRASDVYFDGGGHTIDGNISRQAILDRLPPTGPAPTEGMGIGVNLDGSPTVSNVTVTNVTATEWFYGVLVRSVRDATVSDVTSTTSGIGILLDSTTNTMVERSDASNNGITGVYVSGSANRSDNNTVANATASGNGREGVLLVESPDSTVRDVTTARNGLTGIDVVNSSHSTVRNVTATENEVRGLGTDAIPGNVVGNLTVADSDFGRNGYTGIAMWLTANSTFSNISVAGTRGTLPSDSPVLPPPPSDIGPSRGILVGDGSTGNVFTDIDARDQAVLAYRADDSGPNTVESLQTDAATVSFDGQNVALGPTATVSNATDGENEILAGGLTVTNTSADAFIDLQIAWETTESAAQSANESSSESR